MYTTKTFRQLVQLEQAIKLKPIFCYRERQTKPFGDGDDLGVPEVPSSAPGSLKLSDVGFYHGPQLTHPLSLCQQSPAFSNGVTGGATRSQCLPQLNEQCKRKRLADLCSCSTVQT